VQDLALDAGGFRANLPYWLKGSFYGESHEGAAGELVISWQVHGATVRGVFGAIRETTN